MEELKALAASLTENVHQLRDSVNQLADRTDRHERLQRLTGICLAVDLILSIVVAFLAVSNAHTNHVQEVTRSEVLCPLYSLIIGSYNPTSRPAGVDRETYDRNFVVIRHSYDVLQCTSPIVPPASPPR